MRTALTNSKLTLDSSDFTGNSKIVWVELKDASASLQDVTLTLSFGGLNDVVKATSIWTNDLPVMLYGQGASTVAFDKATGATVWKSGNDGAGYASPVVATIAGKKTVVMFKAAHLVGLDVKDGKELWRGEWKTSYDVNAATPVVVGDKIFVSSGYGSGCGLFEITGGRAVERWRNKNLRAQINSPTVFQGHIYGVDGQVGGGALVCLDFASGAVKWQEKSVSGGALVVADGKLICLTEKGELVIGEVSQTGFKAVSRAQVLGKRNWVQPTYANGRVFCRNNDGDLVGLELK